MADLSTVNAQIQTNPEVQAFLHQIQGLNPEQVHSIPYLMSVVPGLVQKLSPQAQALINSVPHDYVWDWNSQSLTKKSFNDRNPWFLPVVALGTAGLTMGMVPGVPGVGGAGSGGSSIANDVSRTAAQSLTPATTTAAASTIPAWQQIARIAAPATVAAVTSRGGGSSGNQSALDPTQQKLMNDALQMGNDRLRSTQPVHEAAMRMAMAMAPNGEPNPRMTQAVAESQMPRQGSQVNPQVLEAIQRLMAQAGH